MVYPQEILVRGTKTLAFAAAMLLLAVDAAWAAGWSAVSVRGTALSLVGDKWEDLAAGQTLPGDVVVRTLGSGRLSLSGSGAAIALGGNAAVQIVEQTLGLALTQHGGTIIVVAGANMAVSIETPNGIVELTAGSVQIALSGGGMRVEVRDGTVHVIDAAGGQTELTIGQSASVTSTGTELRGADGRPVVTTASGKTLPANASANAVANAGGADAGGNGGNNGNAGGNSGNNGNGGGNENSANGGDTGSSGNSGNGNGGGGENGNGGGNSGGNGNGNGGGNGNGNGNGNGG